MEFSLTLASEGTTMTFEGKTLFLIVLVSLVVLFKAILLFPRFRREPITARREDSPHPAPQPGHVRSELRRRESFRDTLL